MTTEKLYDTITHEHGFKPARMLQTEVSEPLPSIPAVNPFNNKRYERAISLVRLNHHPIGVLELELGEDGLSSEAYTQLVWEQLGSEIEQRRNEAPENDPQEWPPISVIIATHNRTETLSVCLRSLVALDYPNYEIIVVDNAPRTEETADYIRNTYGDNPNVRYVREDIAGLATAHNAGLPAASHDLLVFTDDDVVVDSQWLKAYARAFAAGKNVGCVTGMIFPIEMETPAQMLIEQYGGFNKGFTRRFFDLGPNRPDNPLYPYAAGSFGSGANMAFTKEALQAIGGFDDALGAGSKGVGGDDLASFFDVVSAGYQLVYEPAAIVHHRHHDKYETLCKTMYGYGVGLTAFLTKTIIDKPTRLFTFLYRAPQGLYYALSSNSAKNQGKVADYPAELTALERKGMLYGPIAYVKSRWHVNKRKKQRAQASQITKAPKATTALN